MAIIARPDAGLTGRTVRGPPYPSAWLPATARSAALGASFALWQVASVPQLAAPPARDQALLIEVSVYDQALSTRFAGRPAPSTVCPTGPAGFNLIGGKRRLYLATQPMHTGPLDTPANQPIAGALAEAINMRMIAFDGVDLQGPSARNTGAIRVNDPAGAFDWWCRRTLGFDGFDVVIRRGRVADRRPVGDPMGWPVVGRLITAGLTFDDKAKVIGLRDVAGPLSRAPVLRLYGGTGGLDGDETVRGRYRPRAFGRGFYCAPPQINSALLIHQMNDGPMQACPHVFDGGSALGTWPYVDYPTIADLGAATIAGGDVATCLAEGLFRLGDRPAFTVMALCNGGDATGGYVETRAAIARRVATRNAGYSLADPDQIDTLSFAVMDAAHPAAVGFYYDDGEAKVTDALSEILSGVLGTWVVGASGLLEIGWLRAPSATPDIVVARARITAGEIRMTTAHIPRSATVMEWRRNYRPLAAGERAGNVELSEEDKALWGNAGSYEPATSSNVQAAHGLAQPVVVRGNFALQADARVEAIREQALLGVLRHRYQVPAVQGDPFARWSWRTLQLGDVGRFEWAADERVLCVGTDANGGGETVALECWS